MPNRTSHSKKRTLKGQQPQNESRTASMKFGRQGGEITKKLIRWGKLYAEEHGMDIYGDTK